MGCLVNGDRFRWNFDVEHLQQREPAISVKKGSARDRNSLIADNKSLQELETHLKGSYHHFLIISPSHPTPQKVRGFVDGLIELREE